MEWDYKYIVVGFKLKNRGARYKNSCHHIILIVELEYIFPVLCTETDDKCLPRLFLWGGEFKFIHLNT